MRNKIVSDMNPISIRAFLKAVDGKKFRVQLHYYKDASLNKNFSIADIIVDRVERDCNNLIFYFGECWFLVQIKSDNVLQFYNGDMLYYCVEADGVEAFANIL